MNSIESRSGVEALSASHSFDGLRSLRDTRLALQAGDRRGSDRPSGFGAGIFSLPSTFLFEGFLASAFGFVFWR